MTAADDDTRQPGLRAVRVAMLFVLGCLIVAEIVVGRSDFCWALMPKSSLGLVSLMETSVIEPNPDPQVVIFGTSRARNGCLPTIMEEELGLQRGQVLNLAIGGNDTYTPMTLYERNRERLGRASVVILQIDGFQLYLGESALRSNLVYRSLAPLSDRVAHTGAARWLLLRDYVFRMNVSAAVVREYAKQWYRYRKAPPSVGLDAYGRPALVAFFEKGDPYELTAERFQYWLDWGYAGHEYSPIAESYLRRLVTMAREDGAEVYVVQFPMMPGYVARLREYEGDPYGTLRTRTVPAVESAATVVKFWELPEDAGLTEGDFVDWGHVHHPGAEKWSRIFARWIRETRGSRGWRSRMEEPK